MPSRRYLTNAAATYTPTTIRGAWDQSSGTGSFKFGAAPEGSATSIQSTETSPTNLWDVLWGRWISEPVAGGSLSGTVTWVLGVAESATTANDFMHTHIFVTQGDSDAIRGTLLSDSIDTTEFSTSALAMSGGSITITTVTVQSDDRIVIEIGYQAQNTTTQSRFGQIWHGNTGAIDLTAGDTGSLVIERPAWFEFSDPNNVLATPAAGAVSRPVERRVPLGSLIQL